MRAWSRSCGRLDQIESGHCADSKTNVPCRTGESIQPLASEIGIARCKLHISRQLIALSPASANVGELKPVWSILAVAFPVLSTSVSAHNAFYAFERQAKLYGDADMWLGQG